jgi:UDP-3-O-[3-hydroxymyristoyl] glucosamine N-acyltransferase
MRGFDESAGFSQEGNMTLRTVKELAQHLSCAIEGDGGVRLRGVAGPEWASEQDLVYVDSPRHLDRIRESKAACVITSADLRVEGKTLLLAEKPKVAFVKAAAWLAAPVPSTGIHPTAVIAGSARMGTGVTVGPFAVIEEDVTVGDGSEVGAFCFLGRGARLGKGCRLHPRVTVYAGTRLGDGVAVHAGAVLGSDGFGYVTDQGRHWKFPQVGSLEIGDDAEIGANTTVDRGSLGVTRLGAQVKIDNLVHLAHNVEIGERTIIAAQTGVAGSSIIGRDVLIGGQAGLGEHCRLEDGSILGGQCGILPGKIVRRGQIVWGTPARSLGRFKEQHGWIAKLPELAQRVSVLEGSVQGAKSKAGS